MAIIQRYTYKAANTVLGGQDVISLDYFKLPFQASVLVDVVSGLISYGIEFTADDLMGPPGSFRWITDPALPNGQSASGLFVINAPVTALRLNIQTFTGEVRITVIQPIGSGI
jgi:hypothetical protein